MIIAIKKMREGERRLAGEERRGAAAPRRGEDGGGVYRTVWRSRPKENLLTDTKNVRVNIRYHGRIFYWSNFFFLIIRKINE